MKAPTPLIGLSPNELPPAERRLYKGKALEYGERGMAEAVRRAGGLPMMLYRAGAKTDGELAEHAAACMAHCDGLLLTGGDDVTPALYGEELGDPAWAGDLQRDRWEIALYRAALAAGRPVLGVCRGAQLINVAEGGSLFQDVQTMRPGAAIHRSQDLYDALQHGVTLAPGAEIGALFGDEPRRVNSVHHQALKAVGPALEVVAWADDGGVEAFVRRGEPWVWAVQWHPEWMVDRRPSQLRLFRRFVERAAC